MSEDSVTTAISTQKDSYKIERRQFDALESLLLEGKVGDEIPDLRLDSNTVSLWVAAPTVLRFFCPGEECMRQMASYLSDDDGRRDTGNVHVPMERACSRMLTYRCLYCHTMRTITLLVLRTNNFDVRKVIKAGEWPTSGPPLPRDLLKIAGPSGGFLLKGYQAEMSGFGLAAISCYRRVVEDRKNEILGQIRKTVAHLDDAPELQAALAKAVDTRRFATAMELVKDQLPRALFVDDKNPLSILFNTMSEAFHSWSDQKCLAEAALMRVTLTLLIERMRSLVESDGEFRELLNKIEKASGADGGNAA